MLAHGGVAGAFAEALLTLLVVAIFVAVWQRERRRGGDDEAE
jgi:hypothetical protein